MGQGLGLNPAPSPKPLPETSPAAEPCLQRVQRQLPPPRAGWDKEHRLPQAHGQSRACCETPGSCFLCRFTSTQENQPNTAAASPSQHSFQLPEGTASPAIHPSQEASGCLGRASGELLSFGNRCWDPGMDRLVPTAPIY